ncbi:MAG TPA: TetR/AcrR family transcriptional regulator [Streptosporangiaceae bacterium]|nr:TetR/AcrR family transcriptional regulator [Streptosporangiaceae bacterium]
MSGTGSPAATSRRTQADRSATTRAALADAAIDVLIDHGWAAVTAIEVCSRAGVTRGAFHHHYPSLPSLLADALRRVYATMGEHEQPAPADLTGLIDATWAAIGNPRFKAVLEAWLAMANDPGLRAEIGPVVDEFAALVSPDAMPSVLTSAKRRGYYLMARETMLGLALGRATNRGRPLGHEPAVLAQLRTAAAALDGSG